MNHRTLTSTDQMLINIASHLEQSQATALEHLHDVISKADGIDHNVLSPTTVNGPVAAVIARIEPVIEHDHVRKNYKHTWPTLRYMATHVDTHPDAMAVLAQHPDSEIRQSALETIAHVNTRISDLDRWNPAADQGNPDTDTRPYHALSQLVTYRRSPQVDQAQQHALDRLAPYLKDALSAPGWATSQLTTRILPTLVSALGRQQVLDAMKDAPNITKIAVIASFRSRVGDGLDQTRTIAGELGDLLDTATCHQIVSLYRNPRNIGAGRNGISRLAVLAVLSPNCDPADRELVGQGTSTWVDVNPLTAAAAALHPDASAETIARAASWLDQEFNRTHQQKMNALWLILQAHPDLKGNTGLLDQITAHMGPVHIDEEALLDQIQQDGYASWAHQNSYRLTSSLWIKASHLLTGNDYISWAAHANVYDPSTTSIADASMSAVTWLVGRNSETSSRENTHILQELARQLDPILHQMPQLPLVLKQAGPLPGSVDEVLSALAASIELAPGVRTAGVQSPGPQTAGAQTAGAQTAGAQAPEVSNDHAAATSRQAGIAVTSPARKPDHDVLNH